MQDEENTGRGTAGRGAGFVLLGSAIVFGCATTSKSNQEQPLVMEPVVVRAEADPVLGLETYDAETLFDVGRHQFRAKKWARAAEVFERLITEFPNSTLVPAARFNLGLSHERLEQWQAAAHQFARVVEEFPEETLVTDALFNLARNYGKLEEWEGVADTYWAARQRDDLSSMDEIEARSGTGVGLFMQGDYPTAEREFRGMLKFYEGLKERDVLPAQYFVGQARFYIGLVSVKDFEAVILSPPTAAEEEEDWTVRMGDELERKCELLLRAQSAFIRTIRVGHRGWATAAGFQIGKLYERLFDEIMAVPVPEDLEPSVQEVYREELRDRVAVLVKKAIRVYEANREMAERVGEENEWVEKTSAALERMKELYLSNAS